MHGMTETENGVLLSVRVKAGSGAFSISSDDDLLTIHTRRPAKDNKANMEIIKELSRLFEREVKIVRGLKNKHKEIFVAGISATEVEKVLM